MSGRRGLEEALLVLGGALSEEDASWKTVDEGKQVCDIDTDGKGLMPSISQEWNDYHITCRNENMDASKRECTIRKGSLTSLLLL
jgi:hypothetical protein